MFEDLIEVITAVDTWNADRSFKESHLPTFKKETLGSLRYSYLILHMSHVAVIVVFVLFCINFLSIHTYSRMALIKISLLLTSKQMIIMKTTFLITQ